MANFKDDIISLVINEKQKYNDASKDIRDDIKQARKNYAAKFNNQYTSTGHKKVFVPLTH